MKKDDRVKFTKKAFEYGLTEKNREGKVAYNPKRKDRITILWDGRKSTETYHTDFIELLYSNSTVQINRQ